jgi:glycosyltransferase involved in cell wall biosynthesis
MKPTVSVCMPTYNYARYLPEAIESVLRQSYGDFELLIIDDCSQDNSVAIIKKYAQLDGRIVYKVNESNVGMVRNWNLCLKNTNGKYVKFLFGDDVLASPDALKKMVSIVESEADAVLVASSRYIMNENSEITGIQSDYIGQDRRCGTEVIQECLLEQQNKIGEPSVVLFRRENAERGFNEKYKQIVDLEMWFHILEQGGFAFVNEPLCSFRRHSQQQTQKNLAVGFDFDESFSLLRDFAGKSYVKLSTIKRAYMYYLPAYSIWQQHAKHQKISRQTAVNTIRRQYRKQFYRFVLFYPLFKVLKLWMATKKDIVRFLKKRRRIQYAAEAKVLSDT